MRATPTILLLSGFAVFASAAVMGAAEKFPGLRSSFLNMNAFAAPVSSLAAPVQDVDMLRAEAWTQYRAQVRACAAEPLFFQDACFQQARRERKQSFKTLRR